MKIGGEGLMNIALVSEDTHWRYTRDCWRSFQLSRIDLCLVSFVSMVELHRIVHNYVSIRACSNCEIIHPGDAR